MRRRLKSVLNGLNGEKGSVFPVVLILLLLGALMLPALLSYVETGIVSGSMYRDKSQELYAADAGATDALWLLERHTPGEMQALMQSDSDGDPEKYTCDLPDPVNGKTVQYVIEIEGNYYIIYSTATGPDGSSTTIEVWATPRTDKNPPLYAAASLNGDLVINAELGSDDEEEYTDYVGDGDGMTKTFNLKFRKISEDPMYPVEYPMYPIEVTVGGVLQTWGETPDDGGDYTVDYENGQLTFEDNSIPDDGAIVATYWCTPGWVSTYAYGLTNIKGSAVVYGDAHYYDQVIGTYGEDYGVAVSAYLAGEEIRESTQLWMATPKVPTETYEGSLDDETIEDLYGGVLPAIHITGDLKLDGGVVELTGNVWVDGQIDIRGGAIVTDNRVGEDKYADPYYIVSSYSGGQVAITVNGSAPDDGTYPYKVHAALYACSSGATMRINGDGALDGSALASGDVEISGSATLRNTLPLYEKSIYINGMDIFAWKIT